MAKSGIWASGPPLRELHKADWRGGSVQHVFSQKGRPMSIIGLLLREIQHRKLNFLAGVVAVVGSVALSVAILTVAGALQRETTRVMGNLGFNLLIVAENTDMLQFWSEGFAREEMPERHVHRLADSEIMTIRHLAARLAKKTEWRGREVLLTGILPAVPIARRTEKPPSELTILPGAAYVGFELAQSMNIKIGDTIAFGHKQLVVQRCLEETGSQDDIRIYAHLHEVQALLDKAGRINEIQALAVLGASLATIRNDVAGVLPDTKVIEFAPITAARTRTHRMVKNHAGFVIIAVLLAAGILIALLTLGNVRERRVEIGVFRAMGIGSAQIAALFLGKAVLVGLIGAALGFAVGTWLALHFGPQIFPLTAQKIVAKLSLLSWSLVGAPLLCVIASYLPTVHAIVQDPAEVLREE